MHFVRSECTSWCLLVPWSTEARWKDDEGEGRRGSVEEDGVRVSVGYLRHVFQNIFFSDDSQQPPNDTQREREGKENKKSHGKSRLLHIILGLRRHGKSKEVTESRDARRVEVWSCLDIVVKFSFNTVPEGKWLAAGDQSDMKTQSKQSEEGKHKRSH